MHFIRDLPLKRKLTLIMVSVSSIVVVLAGLAFITHELDTLRKSKVKGLSVLSSIISTNTMAALEFEEKESATETLSALINEPRVVFGGLLQNKEIFASYLREDQPRNRIQELPFAKAENVRIDTHFFSEEYLHYFKPIRVDPENTAILYLCADLKDLQAQVHNHLVLSSGILIVSIIIGLMISIILSNLISKPILDLVATTKAINENQDYSKRAEVRGNGEVGQLVQSFNTMIEGVEERDNMLTQHQENLESEVSLRTSELKISMEKAKDAARIKAEFLANMSHEIRTPMNGVIGLTELVLDTPLDSDQKNFILTLKDSAEALMGIINNVLDFSKIEAGKLDISPIPFDLASLISKSLTPLNIRAETEDLIILSSLSPTIPHKLIGDPGRIRQVFTNLVGNAIKFTKKGHIKVRGEIKEENDDLVKIHFTVEDTGIGIPKNRQDRVFNSFSQADGSVTREYGGTGLGLTITRELIHLMEGEIWLESEVNVGTTFHFTLCLEKQKDVSHQTWAELSESIVDLGVLIIDGSEESRKIYEEILKTWNIRFKILSSCKQAKELLLEEGSQECSYRMIFIDDRLEENSTSGFISQLRNQYTIPPKMVLVTSGKNPSKIRSYKKLGVDFSLLKPIDASRIFDAIQGRLDQDLLDDHPPQGTVTITKNADAANEKAQQSKTEAQAEQQCSQAVAKILLVEDNRVNQRVALGFLEKVNHQVVVANNGQDALDHLDHQEFDLILMDLQMPIMGGLEATKRIREEEQQSGKHLPIVAMTAHALESDRRECLANGFDYFLTKPIQAALLYSTIQGILDGNGNDKSEDSTPGSNLQSKIESFKFDQDLFRDKFLSDEDLLHEVLLSFRESSSKNLRTITKSIQNQDSEQLSRSSHSLKGSLGLFGCDALTELCQRLEDVGRQSDFDQAQAYCDEIQQHLPEFIKKAEEFLESLEAQL